MNKILQQNLNKVTKDTAIVIQKDWNNDDVNAFYKTRSTSVGDKIIINNKTFEYCASGIREIT